MNLASISDRYGELIRKVSRADVQGGARATYPDS